ncbi:MAG TPA: helix-turn-helix domain-containing protein [Vulgatibacter sp.]|nr:helix-turn-helix domain-containing protein [Vulgatibacter sp.]
MSVSPRRAREIARTRQDILEAAARAFVQSGFRAATMQDIAREAGYTAASLYGYFSSKEEILRELHALVMEELSATYTAPFPAGLSLRQKLEIQMRRHLEVAKRRFDLFALFHTGLSELSCPVSVGGDSLFGKKVELFARFIEEHRGDEDLGGRTPREVALAITGISYAFFVDLMQRGAPIRGDQLPVVMDLIFHGLSRPSGEPAEG